MKTKITHKELLAIFDYCSVSGVFTRKSTSRKSLFSGEIAGCVHRSDGYVHIKINGAAYMAHRLAWLYVNGVWPEGHIDHIDGEKTNNAILNLRDVSRSINLQNQKRAHVGKKSGLPLGVHFSRGGRFMAQIRINGKNKSFGTFDTPEIAHEAYLKAKESHHPGFVKSEVGSMVKIRLTPGPGVNP